MNRNSLIQKLSSPQKETRETEFQIPETKATYNKNKIKTERQIFFNLQFRLISQAPNYVPTIKAPNFPLKSKDHMHMDNICEFSGKLSSQLV